MKQILEKSDIDEAIAEYLTSRGFSVERLRIRYSLCVEGATPSLLPDNTTLDAEVSGLTIEKPRPAPPSPPPTPSPFTPPTPALARAAPVAGVGGPRIDPRTIPLPSPKTGKITGLPPEAQGLTPEQIKAIAEGRGEFAFPVGSGPEFGTGDGDVESADSLEELGIVPDYIDPRELGPIRGV